MKKQTERDKSLIRFYKRVKNIAEVAREYNVSRQRIHQILIKNEIGIDKKGNQGRRTLSPHVV